RNRRSANGISENDLQRKLHDPRIARKIGDLPKLAAGHVIIGKTKVRVVECIEHVPTQIETPSFTEILEAPRQAHVELCGPGSSHRVAAAITQPNRICRRGEVGGIEPSINGSLIRREISTSKAIAVLRGQAAKVAQ